MVMLQGYMDDSGSEPQSKVFLLSGFILETENWERFSDEWQYQLRRDPRIEYFKMYEASAREGQFRGWREEFVLCKVKDLLSVIEHYQPTGISCMVDWRDYLREFGALAVDDLKGPYALLFQLAFQAIKRHQQRLRIYPTAVDVDFDDQGKVGKFAAQLYGDMKERFPAQWKQMLGRMPIMLNEKEVLPLQAADMLAWSERNSLVRENSDWNWLYSRLDPLVKSRMQYDAEDLRMLVYFKDNPHLPDLPDV
jgi:hypothetical protein